MIPLNTPFLEGNEKKYLNDVIDSKWLSRGGYNERFEEEFAEYCGVNYGLSVTSGTVAVQVLLMACSLQGSMVAIPAYTCMSVAQAVVHAGVTPVFIDIELETLGMSFKSLKRMYEDYRFKAVLINHLYGRIAKDTPKIVKWCKKNNIMVLEDASEAHGATLHGKKAGSFGIASAFSMRSEKMIGVGEGGMVVTKSKDIYDKAYYWINDARPSNKIRYWTTGEGWNFFMPNALGAIGLAQLEQLPEIIKRKRKIADMYAREFSKRPNNFVTLKKYGEPVYWLNAVFFTSNLLRNDLIEMYKEVEIETRPPFYPLNLLPSYRKYPTDNTLNANKVLQQLMIFPSNVYMTQKDIDLIFGYFDKFIGNA